MEDLNVLFLLFLVEDERPRAVPKLGGQETRAGNSNVQELWDFEKASCFCLLPFQFLSVFNVRRAGNTPAGEWGLPSHRGASASFPWDVMVKACWWITAHIALSPANCCLAKIFSTAIDFSLYLSAKEKVESPVWVQGRDSKYCHSCTALQDVPHAVMHPHRGPSGAPAGFWGRQHHRIEGPALQRCSTYMIPRAAHAWTPGRDKEMSALEPEALSLWK